jgi:diguanylate cyclase (GGDEF)-like protein
MNPDEIYSVVVAGMCEVMDGAECSIVIIEGHEATVLARSDGVDLDALVAIPLDRAPILMQSWAEHSTVTTRVEPRNSEGAVPAGSYALAIPMVAGGDVLGLIYFPGDGFDIEPSEATVRFFEVVASIAANALRNVGMFEEMKHLARTDFLTGLPNHRYFQSSLAREVGRAQRHDHALSLLLIDLDCLKKVNDRFGHQAGDSVTREVAGTISRTCREIDFAARYGGEEFVVILPETDLQGAVLVAERIRRNIEATEVEVEVGVTASIGVASYPANATTSEDLIRTADQALYVAKNAGRNQVSHFKHQLTAR